MQQPCSSDHAVKMCIQFNGALLLFLLYCIILCIFIALFFYRTGLWRDTLVYIMKAIICSISLLTLIIEHTQTYILQNDREF